jgi:hypothetical protein
VITTCEHRRFFHTCGQPGVAICQYCGDTFCGQHGSRLADGQEICYRPRCRRKKDDLDRHGIYKESVVRRNNERLCGDPSCDQPPAGQCSKCHGVFCHHHLEEQEIEVRRGPTVRRVRGSLCGHCRDRRRLWARR